MRARFLHGRGNVLNMREKTWFVNESTDGWMDGWMDGQMHMHAYGYRWMDGWMDIDGSLDAYIWMDDGWMDIDGWILVLVSMHMDAYGWMDIDAWMDAYAYGWWMDPVDHMH